MPWAVGADGVRAAAFCAIPWLEKGFGSPTPALPQFPPFAYTLSERLSSRGADAAQASRPGRPWGSRQTIRRDDRRRGQPNHGALYRSGDPLEEARPSSLARSIPSLTCSCTNSWVGCMPALPRALELGDNRVRHPPHDAGIWGAQETYLAPQHGCADPSLHAKECKFGFMTVLEQGQISIRLNPIHFLPS